MFGICGIGLQILHQLRTQRKVSQLRKKGKREVVVIVRIDGGSNISLTVDLKKDYIIHCLN